uniref:non-reducing end alpha-L-arabinofuranosidase n=1 Tax=Mycena chlorophos TaxID=658473 RepID=A0ABQ0KY68_MYCCL|nr:glycoside hydrolase family 51 protein [Mycena chlorophos]
MPTIHIDPARKIAPVDPRIYSGFTEHMGRCIYGGLYEPGNTTKPELVDERGYRKDVLAVLKELKVPVVRYPGGNFVSTYRWQDGVGPKELRPRRPELAWLTEESNQFGTDEFIAWCRELGAEPYLCLNMGTGTLEDALGWLEYCNSSANTHYANLRRENGHAEPYGVKYWALGNEVWGPWQVGQMSAGDYAKTAFQWAKALRLLDPSIKLVSCGETGFSDWDRVVLKTLAPVVDYHSIHLYTQSKGSHDMNVMGPAAAEKGIEISKSLIDLALIEHGLSKEITVCFDEWNVWDPIRAPGEKGAEEHYDLSDALAVASWLNVFIRKADVVKFACIAQSVNVISPIITSPSGLFKQTTFYPLWLFSNLMQGTALDVYVSSEEDDDDFYAGETEPLFIAKLAKHTPQGRKPTRWLDVSAVLSPDGREIRIAIVNRHATKSFSVPLAIALPPIATSEVTIHEVYHPDLAARNGWDGDKVQVATRAEVLSENAKSVVELKEHSQLFIEHARMGLGCATVLVPWQSQRASHHLGLSRYGRLASRLEAALLCGPECQGAAVYKEVTVPRGGLPSSPPLLFVASPRGAALCLPSFATHFTDAHADMTEYDYSPEGNRERAFFKIAFHPDFESIGKPLESGSRSSRSSGSHHARSSSPTVYPSDSISQAGTPRYTSPSRSHSHSHSHRSRSSAPTSGMRAYYPDPAQQSQYVRLSSDGKSYVISAPHGRDRRGGSGKKTKTRGMVIFPQAVGAPQVVFY